MTARETGGPSAAEMGINTPENKADAEKTMNEYYEGMRRGLEDLIVSLTQQNSPESDIRTAMAGSLDISNAFQSILHDTRGEFDVQGVQAAIDQKVRLLRLSPDQFSVVKFRELIDKAQ